MEQGGKELLMKRLDECLMDRANEYMSARDGQGRPFIENIYYLQAFSEMHFYLKAVHEFTPREINDLLQFKDPLTVARHCWEENPDRYCFCISDIIKSERLREKYPLQDGAETEQGGKPSLRAQLQKAQDEMRSSQRQKPAPDKGKRGGDAR